MEHDDEVPRRTTVPTGRQRQWSQELVSLLPTRRAVAIGMRRNLRRRREASSRATRECCPFFHDRLTAFLRALPGRSCGSGLAVVLMASVSFAVWAQAQTNGGTMDVNPSNFKTISWQAIGVLTGLFTALLGAVISVMLRKGQRQREALIASENYRREILDFANQVIDTMSQTRSLIATNPCKASEPRTARDAFYSRWSRLRSDISSLIDRGRFFFPNHEYNMGQEKGSAHEGRRDPVLNRIMSAYFCMKAIDYRNFALNSQPICLRSLKQDNKAGDRERNLLEAFRHLSKEEQDRLNRKSSVKLDDLVVSARRSFVSELFSIIQPRDWLKKVEKIHGISLRSRGAEPLSNLESVP